MTNIMAFSNSQGCKRFLNMDILVCLACLPLYFFGGSVYFVGGA